MYGLLRNVLSNWSVLGLSLVVSFALMPIMIGRLGETAYGILVLVNTFAAYASLFRGGLGGAVIQGVAAARGRTDQSAAAKIASAVFALYWVLAGLVVVAGLLLAWYLPGWFGIEPRLVAGARGLTLCTVSLLALQFPGSVFGGILYGSERFDRANIAVATGLALRTAGLLVFVLNDGHLLRLGLVQLGAGIVELCISALLAYNSCPDIRLHAASPFSHEARAAARFGVGNLVLNTTEKVVHETDPLVVGAALPLASVTVFGVGAALPRYARLLLQEMTRVLGPGMGRLHAAGDREALRQAYLQMTRLSFMLALPVVGFGIFLGDDLLRLWVGSELGSSLDQATLLMRLLLAPLLLAAPQTVATSVLWGMGRLRLPSIVYATEAVLNLGLSLWWVREFGLPGVAAGTLVPVLLIQTWWLPRVAMREIGVSLRELLGARGLRPAFWLVPFVAGAGFATGAVGPLSAMGLVIASLLLGLTYLTLAWKTGTTAEERDRLRQLIPGRGD